MKKLFSILLLVSVSSLSFGIATGDLIDLQEDSFGTFISKKWHLRSETRNDNVEYDDVWYTSIDEITFTKDHKFLWDRALKDDEKGTWEFQKVLAEEGDYGVLTLKFDSLKKTPAATVSFNIRAYTDGSVICVGNWVLEDKAAKQERYRWFPVKFYIVLEDRS